MTTVRCAKCGEELLGAVNSCWRCGTAVLSLAGETGMPPVRAAQPTLPKIGDTGQQFAQQPIHSAELVEPADSKADDASQVDDTGSETKPSAAPGNGADTPNKTNDEIENTDATNDATDSVGAEASNGASSGAGQTQDSPSASPWQAPSAASISQVSSANDELAKELFAPIPAPPSDTHDPVAPSAPVANGQLGGEVMVAARAFQPARVGSPFAAPVPAVAVQPPAPIVPNYPKNSAANGAAMSSLILGVMSCASAAVYFIATFDNFLYVISALLLATLGVVMGLWGLFSNMSRVSAAGLILCCLGLSVAGFGGAIEIYKSIYGVSPFSKQPPPAPVRNF